jgi:hypothetical protein
MCLVTRAAALFILSPSESESAYTGELKRVTEINNSRENKMIDNLKKYLGKNHIFMKIPPIKESI